jgi:hypothetical protein
MFAMDGGGPYGAFDLGQLREPASEAPAQCLMKLLTLTGS